MTIHTLEPQAGTLHGTFSREIAPAIEINPGDTVRLRTLEANWAVGDVDPDLLLQGRAGITCFSPRDQERDSGHALTGPVAVRGAQPGMMLAVQINRIVPGTWGWSYPWYGTPYEQKDRIPYMVWRLDARNSIARNHLGHTVAMRPFMGVMGVALDEPGYLSTKPPRPFGGNMDCKELVAGSTLYLPVAVPGALFSTGDGHAAQGDGESSGTAIECPMEMVDLSFDLVENPPIPTLHANTPAGWITFGFDEDLNLAADAAVAAMLRLISAHYNVSHDEALSLAGVAVDLRITQIVNQVKGVHAVLPHGAIR
ncbi:MAG: acetamidase/formamidase family protein [bacterium]|nr:acetamidase/formamidase family protein [bacterium]